MAEGHEPYDDPSLKGVSRYFNNKTIKGRANVCIVNDRKKSIIFILDFISLFEVRLLALSGKVAKKTMAGGDANVDSSKLSGISKIFNGQTVRGRAHVAMATYASVGLLIAYFALKPKSKK
ncbi:hypothetical protein NQ317_014399 [Molorchus minor]|uniref:Up-regulated during skeletal muscle growth protein 5 n=1 Tax=Molorchus minor TaxID=1323400 RepID=A0ABQ9K560_9CUCU|nr:hypothetical protein NQ317_014399 [Molorchus minor]